MLTDKNLAAFAIMVRTGEGTLGDNGYHILYGGGYFESYHDHPRIKIKAGNWISSAAGAYQILEKTWDNLLKQFPAVLTDFSPDCQDLAFIKLIKGRDAYDDVIAGRFKSAILKCNKEWASLPLSPYGQPVMTMEKALQIIKDAGGVFADEVQPKEKDMSLVGTIVMEALPKLIGVLPELAATLKKSDVAERNVELATKIGGILVDSTASTNAQEAVERVLADSQTANEANTALRMSRADLLDVVERVNAMDQGNIKAARDYNTAEPITIDTKWLKLKFIHVLSLLFVVFAGSFVAVNFSLLSAELKGSIITLMIIGGWNGVKDYWMGSSNGSDKKTEMLTK